MLHFDEEQVRGLLSYEELIPVMERVLIRFSSGQIQQPVRSLVMVPEHSGIFGMMPAVDGDVIGIKLVLVYEKNVALGLPTHQAVIQLFSAKTGEPLVSMDGRLITEMRTAAVSGVATKLLSKPDARVLAVLGTGVQSRAHIRALRLVRSFEEIRVWGRTPLHAQQVAEELGVRVMLELEQAVRGSDVVVSVAHVNEPLVRGEWLGPDAYVNAVATLGSHRRELDDAVMGAAIVVESREAAMRESGDILKSGASVYAELGELLAGSVALPFGRRVYKALGIGAEDVAAARLVYDKAVR
ncbi:ornithine cyclodeaminase family protein [Alloacidobacterium dinghuense]|uniref:Ornithine cyclodeaminase family protein n=1 Tax=Alloacidobacterium dinghuense TaxID=2763107 RepID=A0A7G8BGU1_9BACT|nr:ornithine cyclodeaminase family protein [Alloacidobacterium dinghuense]QNI31761.1 ornithine cyclodeaminase family protein [Alloacidobacterium dinghuense]